MKLHRDAAPTIPAQAMAPYQTPPTERSTLRAELGRIGIIALIVGIVGTFLVLSLYLLTKDLRIVGAGIWLTGLAIIAYLLWYAWQSHMDMSARHALDRARIYAEIDALTTFDTNADGTADPTEIDTFIRYIERLHRPPGAPTTAAYAQSMGIAGPKWTGYKDWLVKKGYANIVKRSGGPGFVLKPSVFATPWPKLEAQLRKRVHADLGAMTSAGAFTFDPDDVSTLGKG